MGEGRRVSRTDLKKSANVLKKKKNRKKADNLDLPSHQSAITITETCANFSHGFPRPFTPDKHQNRASTGVHRAESRLLILMSD